MTNLLSFREDGSQWAWDATSLSTFAECPRKYLYSILQGWAPANKSVHLIFGGLYASALEHYHKHIADGVDVEEATRLVLRELLVETWDSEAGQPIDWLHNTKTRDTLIRSVIWYLDQFRDDTMTTVILQDGRAAVEYSFSFELSEDILYCGHIDRLVEYGGDIYVQDQKAQPVSEPVLTPGGWRDIGDLTPGDCIVGTDGEYHEVLDIYPHEGTEVFEVSFTDGTSTRCARGHLWGLMNTAGKYVVRSLEQLIEGGVRNSSNGGKYYLPEVAPVQFPEADLPLHPLALGLLIGDGYLNANTPQFSDKDGVEATLLSRVLPSGDDIIKSSGENYSWNIRGGKTRKALENLGMYWVTSREKYIPDSYLFASEAQRRHLLWGLLLTDGHKLPNKYLYDSVSEQLVRDVCFLVRSLGGQASYHSRSGDAFRAHLSLAEWGRTRRRFIKDIKLLDYEEQSVCLKVSSPDSLYLTRDLIPTHNTSGSTITQRFFDNFSPDIQMTGYTLAGNIIFGLPVKGVVIDAAQIAVGFTAFSRGFVQRTEAHLEEFANETLHYIEAADRAHESGYYPMNRTSCGNYGGCQFRNVCRLAPNLREQYLQGNFVRRERWDPLKRR